MIDSKFAIKYLDLFLQISAINPKLKIPKYKFWVKSLIFILFILVIKHLITLQIISVDNYKLCVYLGDISLLFPSLRKFTLISLSCLLILSTLILIIFNFNQHNQWYVIFRCFQRKSSPKSAGFKSKWILIRMFILTEITFNILICVVVGLYLLIFLIGSQLMIRKFYKEPIKIYQIFKLLDFSLLIVPIDELIMWLLWLIPSAIVYVPILILTVTTSNYLFQLVCYHCLLTAKHMNELIKNINSDLIKFNFRKKFLIKLRIKYFIKQYCNFSNQVFKYNRFWSQFYLSIVITILPGDIFCIQQMIFGAISFEIRFMLILLSILGMSFIVLSSLLVCFLANEIRKPYKDLVKLQFENRLGITTNEKIKVFIICLLTEFIYLLNLLIFF